MAIIDLKGQKFGRLTVLELAGLNKYQKAVWRCSCACGSKTEGSSNALRSGQKKSCGCLRLDNLRKAVQTHGYTGKPEYRTWHNIKTRCYNQNKSYYPNYGGRGIRVCERWLNGGNGKTGFECFLEDMGDRPSRNHSIERVDNDGNYSPDNCIWATRSEQNRNHRRNHIVSVRGKDMTFTDACKEVGISYGTAQSRLRSGWSIEEIFTIPAANGRQIHGKRLNIEQVAEIFSKRGTDTAEAVARDYPVNAVTVGDIWRGKTWSHVTGAQ